VRIVEGVGAALVAADEEHPGAWAAMGFTVGPARQWQGCRAHDVSLHDADIRLLLADGQTTLSAAVRKALADGRPLLGWTWTCADIGEAARAIESRSGVSLDHQPDNVCIELPAELTPGALTLLEAVDGAKAPVDHPNAVSSIDHLVLMAPDAEQPASVYADNFALSPRVRDLPHGRYAFLKAGATILEISANHEAPVPAAAWGLALQSADIGVSVAAAQGAGHTVSGLNKAIQGGLIASVTDAPGGLPLAFMQAEQKG
jgi:predicted enzyme related to lactoylglutathione lyase